MWRITAVLRRTSRKGPGSWTEPTLLDSNHRAVMPGGASPATRGIGSTGGRGGHGSDAGASSVQHRGLRRRRVTGADAAGSSSSSFYDDADNAARHVDAGTSSTRGPSTADPAASPPDTSYYSWKADLSRNRPPLHMDPTMSSLRGNQAGGLSQNVKRVGTTTPPVEELCGSGSGAAGGECTSPNWLGGARGHGAVPDTLERATLQHAFGSGDFSMVDRKKLTLTRLAMLMVDATCKPRDADSRAFGGDGATKLAEQREELKSMDQRIVPIYHEDVMNDTLKNIDQLHSPSGAVCQREILKGRLVGLLFFTESERSLTFMRHLQRFHKQHSPDFVVVALSLAGKEMMDVTRSFGFFHCTHRDGATWVGRDTGLMVRPLVPLPRLIIVHGTTGMEITRSGVTAVVANPHTCFQAWKQNEVGFRYRDFLKSMNL